jgi:cytochrome c peroxidase
MRGLKLFLPCKEQVETRWWFLPVILVLLFSPSAYSVDSVEVCRRELHLSATECRKWEQTILPLELPPAIGNRFGDHLGAAALGHRLFFESRLATGGVQCSTCHLSERAYTEDKPYSKGLREVSRNAPSIYNAARLTRHFWDGRADTLWSQPLFTMEDPDEMNLTRLELAHKIYKIYRTEYEQVFGPMPDLSDLDRFPERGKPGTPAFDSMPPQSQIEINQVFANIGKAFEAFIRQASGRRSPVDLFLVVDRAPLSEAAKRGMIQFTRAGCMNCHSGPMYTDEKFHNLGIPAWPGAKQDLGRELGRQVLTSFMFNSESAFFDPVPSDHPIRPLAPEANSPGLRGAFLTPSLRNVARTAPYGHNGRFKTLEEIIDFHLQGGGRGAGFVGQVDPLLKPAQLTSEQKMDLAEFLRNLTGLSPPMPWATWPGR